MVVGIVQGRQLDLVSYLLVALHNRFAALEEESMHSVMPVFFGFTRRQREGIDEFLSSYKIVVQRAVVEGQLQMNVDANAFQLLRALGTTPG